MDLKNLVKGLLAEVSKISKSDAVVGGVRDAGRAKVVPLSRIRLGFGVGMAGAGGERAGKTPSDGKAEAGGAGGVVAVEPRAFVVVGEDGLVHMLALKQGKAAVARRGVEILPEHYEHLRLGDEQRAQLSRGTQPGQSEAEEPGQGSLEAGASRNGGPGAKE